MHLIIDPKYSSCQSGSESCCSLFRGRAFLGGRKSDIRGFGCLCSPHHILVPLTLTPDLSFQRHGHVSRHPLFLPLDADQKALFTPGLTIHLGGQPQLQVGSTQDPLRWDHIWMGSGSHKAKYLCHIEGQPTIVMSSALAEVHIHSRVKGAQRQSKSKSSKSLSSSYFFQDLRTFRKANRDLI